MFHHAAGSVSNNFNNNHGSSNSGGGGYGENWSPNIDKAAREFFNHKSNNSNKDNGDEQLDTVRRGISQMPGTLNFSKIDNTQE